MLSIKDIAVGVEQEERRLLVIHHLEALLEKFKKEYVCDEDPSEYPSYTEFYNRLGKVKELATDYVLKDYAQRMARSKAHAEMMTERMKAK